MADGTDTPSLEDRVAALEARLAPVHLTYTTTPPLTEADLAEIRASAAEALKRGPARILPPDPPLTPAQIRYLLRQCATTIKPGETLIIRGRNWTPSQVREIQQVVNNFHDNGTIPFKTLAVAADELGIATPEDTPSAP